MVSSLQCIELAYIYYLSHNQKRCASIHDFRADTGIRLRIVMLHVIPGLLLDRAELPICLASMCKRPALFGKSLVTWGLSARTASRKALRAGGILPGARRSFLTADTGSSI